MDTASDLADIAKTNGHFCFFMVLEGLEADFGSLEELLAELLAGWMAADPSRPSPLNKILLTPFCVLTVFVSPTSFFQFLWSGSARALPLRPPPHPTPPPPRRPALRAVTTAGASRRYKMRRLCFCSVLLMSPCYPLFIFIVMGSFSLYLCCWLLVRLIVMLSFHGSKYGFKFVLVLIYYLFLMCLACFIEFVVFIVDVVGVSISI